MECELIVHLAEIDARRLYRDQAYPSMHAYCVGALHLSDSQAYLRITVARVARKFPEVLEHLRDGRMHLSGLAKLAPHLRPDNVDRVLARAAYRSTRSIEELVAELAPQPDAVAGIRRLPEPGRSVTRAPLQGSRSGSGGEGCSGPEDGDGNGVGSRCADASSDRSPSASGSPSESGPTEPPRGFSRVTPLAPGRYRVQFTASAELAEKLRRAQELLRSHNCSVDLAQVIDRAVAMLLGKLEARRFGKRRHGQGPSSERTQQQSSAPRRVGHRSRHVPQAVKRSVYARDGGQCTYVAKDGRRCEATGSLEFHHIEPYARGGSHRPENLRLLCPAHNALGAERDYGSDWMARYRQGLGDGRAPPIAPDAAT